MDALPGTTMDAVLSASTTAAALTSTVTSAVGTVAAAAATGATEAQLRAEGALKDAEARESTPELNAQAAVAWDAHLNLPSEQDPMVDKMMQIVRRAALGLTSDNATRFSEMCEFVSLGCFCAVSFALKLLGLKRNTFPFDWVRTSLEGIIHCLDVQFEDFLTYSTYSMQGQCFVYGGTRWGGSFWHHNLEAPVTREDMSRRVARFYGQGSVPACTPRVFVRVVNSTREVTCMVRLRERLRRALPEAQEVFLLLVIDLQAVPGPMAIAGPEGHGLLFYSIPEKETQTSLAPQGFESFRLCSESYARAIAFAVKHWAGERGQEDVRMFADLNQLSASLEQFDGGDPARELFVPRKFYGQQLDAFPGRAAMQRLISRMQVHMFVIPENLNAMVPFQAECFGKSLRITLPVGTCSGHYLHLFLNDGLLSASVSVLANGQMIAIGPATVEENVTAQRALDVYGAA